MPFVSAVWRPCRAKSLGQSFPSPPPQPRGASPNAGLKLQACDSDCFNISCQLIPPVSHLVPPNLGSFIAYLLGPFLNTNANVSPSQMCHAHGEQHMAHMRSIVCESDHSKLYLHTATWENPAILSSFFFNLEKKRASLFSLPPPIKRLCSLLGEHRIVAFCPQCNTGAVNTAHLCKRNTFQVAFQQQDGQGEFGACQQPKGQCRAARNGAPSLPAHCKPSSATRPLNDPACLPGCARCGPWRIEALPMKWLLMASAPDCRIKREDFPPCNKRWLSAKICTTLLPPPPPPPASFD